MTVAVVLGWAGTVALLGHLLDRLVRRAARAEGRRAVPAGVPAVPDRGPVPAVPPAVPDRESVPLDRHLQRPRGAAVVPILAALGGLATGLRFGVDPSGLPFLVLVPLLAELAVVDAHTRRLPNVLTLPALPAGLLLVAVAAAAQDRVAVLTTAAVAAVLLFLVLLVLAVLRPAGMGMGDVKAAAVIGLYVGSLGVGPALAALVVAALAAFAGGLVLIATGRIGPRTATPFGPWLAAGALVAVLAGPELVERYLALVG